MFRTGQVFGGVHIVSVLRGEATEAVRRHRHDGLPTFGVGREHGPAFWRGVLRQLVAHGALDVDTAGHGGLFLVEGKARPILRGEVGLTLRRDEPPPAAAREPAVPRRAQSGATGEPDTLFEELRRWRVAEAKTQRVPPYVIFHDSVLREIAQARPATVEELGQIKGVGASKIERYGRRLLAVLVQAAG